ncbi:MAG: histone deacetylase [Dehalococcoidia bacterium]
MTTPNGPRVGLITDPTHVAHERVGHTERPERLLAIMEHLDQTGLLGRMRQLPAREATDEELLAVHDQSVLDVVLDHSRQRGGGWIDLDTYVLPQSPVIARRAAGAAVDATLAVVRGDLSSAFVATRPPGHHATHSASMGFCLFNGIAVAAAAALRSGVERLAIVDWDVHHGNGTQAIFNADPRVLYISTHASPFYPGTGDIGEIGTGDARGTKVNIPLPHGTGDRGFTDAYERVAVPMMERFEPQLVLVSSGWDSHYRDPLGTLNVSTAAYSRAARAVIEAAGRLCDGRIIAVLEGGYDTHALAWSAAGLVELLLGEEPTPDPDPNPAPAGPDVTPLIEAVRGAFGLR